MTKDIKVLILSCGTGGGHNSAAMAIQENLREKNIQADFVEYLEIINKKVKTKVNNLYIKSTKGNGKIFKRVYHLGELYQKTRLKSPIYALNYLNKNKLYKYIQENGYNYVITTHLFAAQALTAIKKEHPIHFIAVATDYVCIPFWEETNPDYFIIPSEDLKADFIKKGIPEEKLLPYGIPVSRGYREKLTKAEAKQKLELKEEKDYILVLTGSMGFGNVYKMIQKLIEKIQNVICIVACGNNKTLLEKINQEYGEKSNIIALGFKTNIYEYMKASEIILTKPGGLTTTEVAVSRKPLIHTMPIPGCENYNAEYFAKRKMGIKCEDVNEVIENTKILLNDQKLQNELIENQKKNICTNTCDRIAQLIEES